MKADELRKEIEDIRAKKVEDRTELDHIKLVKAFGGVRNYLLSMGPFKEVEPTWMQDIARYNCDGMCIHKTCNKRYTKFTEKTINGMKLHLAFCDKHAEAFENG